MNNEDLFFCPLGGSGEIGGNMNLYAYGNDENRKYPHCELIFRTDYDNYNTTYHFKNSDKIY